MSALVPSEQLLTQLNWRYATKQFDPARKIPAAELATLLEAVRLTPSGGGLQPWKFLVITEPTLRAKLRDASHGQPQVTNASHLIVLAARQNFSAADVDAHLARMAVVQGASIESLAPLRARAVSVMERMDEPTRNAWARNQVYIALGTLLTSAALLGIDACPMEGFDRSHYDEILGLKALGYATAVIAPIGYRLPEDKYSRMPKTRFLTEQVFDFIN